MKTKDKKELSCPICSNDINNKVIFAKEMYIGTRDVFKYIFCSSCQSLSILNIPINLKYYYSKYPNLLYKKPKLNFFRKNIYKYLILKNNIISKLLFKRLKAYDSLPFKSLHKYKISKTSKILDVGCGNGSFIEHLVKLGYKNAVGIDPFISYKNISSRIQKKNIFEIEEKYNLIMFNHSFEHQPNLDHICKKLDEILAPKGLCIIRMPNIESQSFRIFKEYWEGIHAPFHLRLPSRKGMKILFKNTTLELVENRNEQPFPLFFFSHNYRKDIANNDHNSARIFFEKKRRFKKRPPLISKEDFKYWKNQIKTIDNTQSSDYIVYYYQKKCTH